MDTLTGRAGNSGMNENMSEDSGNRDTENPGRKNQIDLERFGVFVSRLRSEKGMTQKALAEKLFVSNKAVSKWENGLS